MYRRYEDVITGGVALGPGMVEGMMIKLTRIVRRPNAGIWNFRKRVERFYTEGQTDP
jgi:hypothetical protein